MKLAMDGTVEDLVFYLECSVSALNAVHAAMDEGSSEPAVFVPALFCVYDYQSSLVRQLRALVRDATWVKEESKG